LDNTGTCTHLVGSVHDITERKQAETEIARQAQLLGQAHEPMFAWDLNGTINNWNNAAETLYGFSREEAMGHSSHDLLRTENPIGMEQLDAILESGGFWKGDLLQTTKDGRRLFIEAVMTVVVDRYGRRVVLETGRDITEVKRAREIENRLASDLEHSRDQIRALAASLLKAQEDERRRVSGLLHDTICQELASLAFDIGGLVADTPPSEDAQRRLMALQVRVVKTSEQTRHIAYELYPSVLDDLGLVASLRALCDEFSERAKGTQLKFDAVSLPASLPREVASCMYRVAREILQNVAKHASAKHVSVSLALKNRTVVLSIADDGVGFDAEAVKGHGGLGFIGMEERVRLVKGKLTIAARPGHGTRMVIKVPLPDGT
jgi:PAS domain S-box-containing protein